MVDVPLARLAEETEIRPKPMIEIGGMPILWHIMKGYSSYGINEFVLCLGHLATVIKDYFLHYSVLNSDITVNMGVPDDIDITDIN